MELVAELDQADIIVVAISCCLGGRILRLGLEIEYVSQLICLAVELGQLTEPCTTIGSLHGLILICIDTRNRFASKKLPCNKSCE